MENKMIKYFFSFILAIVLLVSEIILMIQFNISRGITKKDIDEIIENLDIENQIIETKEYENLEEKINPELLQEIIENKEVEMYIKENIKAIYNNILYDENNSYISSEMLKESINNIINQQENNISEEEIKLITKEIENITKKIDEGIENIEIYRNDIKIVSNIVSKKITNYILVFTLLIAALIILINKSKDGYIYVGIPTIIVGVIFLILWLTLSKTIYATGIDQNVIRYINMYLPTLLKTLKKSSIIMIIIGIIGCATYTVLHYQEVQENGKI